MKNILWTLLILSVLFVVGCQPATPPAAPAAPTAPAAPVAPAQPAAPAAPAETAPAVPAETAPVEREAAPMVESGIDISKRCYALVSAEDVKEICGAEGKIVLSPKITSGDCWVNIADQLNNKLTGGFTIVNWDKAVEANREFDRGVKARIKQGAVEGQEVGERSYEYDEIGRHNVVWVRNEFLTRLGMTNDLCPEDKVLDLARKIDSGI